MRNVDKKYHYLYKTTNLINEKYYYGMHSSSKLDDEYLGSGKRLRYSIRKYGKDNFKREIIKMFDTREELIQAEIKLITEDILNEPNCMNLKLGGSGGWSIEQQKINAKNSNIKQKELKEIDIEWFKNKCNNHRNAMYKRLEDGKISTLYFYNWKDKKHSKETKELMSEKAKLRIGDKNSQFGTCWITKDNENKKIKKEDLNQYINDGWFKGRI